MNVKCIKKKVQNKIKKTNKKQENMKQNWVTN